jgi:dTMP kinase
MRGLFISLEGIDGSGKSTQLALLEARLQSEEIPFLVNREPGGVAIGQQIRAILLDPENRALSPVTELLLYFANRAQNIDEQVRPALARGELVVSDRFTDSTLAYQGAARKLGAETVRTLHRIACRGTEPELTVYVRVRPEVSRARRAGQSDDRLEGEALEFHETVFATYEELAAAERERIVTVDGEREAEEVAAEIWGIVAERWRARAR